MPAPRKSKPVRLLIPTSDGEFIARYSAYGLAELRFPSSRAVPATAQDTPVSAQVRQWHRQTATVVKEILAGCAPTEPPPLDVSCGTDFQRSVWTALRKIKTGQTQSYGEIAAALGKPKAGRAVGGACGANPIPLLVPCHRVLAASGKIGGFSGGLDWKKKLLAREGVKTG